MTRLAEELLADIDKDTVDFGPNYDDSHTEPLVFPSRFPNLLVNGTDGIAVGMATNVPPHNLREIIEAMIAGSCAGDHDHRAHGHVPGPDFPTGGSILGRSGIAQAYATGRGRIQVRAKATIETDRKGDRETIVVTEIPFQVNKSELVAKIAELVRDKRLEGISGMPRDESDRDGMRIVVDLKRDANSQVILNQLYKMTAMQTTFGIINLTIVGGRPQILGLKEVLEQFIEHRREVVLRRTRFELREAEAKREIVEGLGMALTEIDAVIHTIRTSQDTDVARERLMRLPLRGLEEFVKRAGRPEEEINEAAARGEYFLSERQAQAILDMRLSRLTGLEQEKLAAEYAVLCDTIARLQAILASEERLKQVIVGELAEIRDRFGDARRTEILAEEGTSDRGPHRRRGHDRHVLTRRLHQAHAGRRAPGAAPRWQGQGRHGDPRGGLGQPDLRRLHALVRPVLQRQGQGLPEEGLRDPGGEPHLEGARHRELRGHGARREGRRHRPGPRVRRGATS
jgi:DNA gyrase subunit A